MAIQLGSAYGKVSLDVKGLLNAVKSGKAGLTELSAVGKQVGQTLQNVGKTLTVGLTLPIVGLGLAAVNAASSFEETKNKALVVFEDMSDGVVANADRAANALGVGKQKYLDYASAIGAALKAGDMSIEETTKLSENAVKHMSDLASFHEARLEDVGAAWQSAIRGQYEPIQRYFPFITSQFLITYGTANGLIDANTKQLTANQRAVILNAIAFDEKLNPALDDFQETAGSLANQTRSAKEEFHNLLITLGENLLPIALKVVTEINKMLEKFNNMSPAMQKATIGIGVFLAALGPLLSMLGWLVSFASSIAGLVSTLSAMGISLASIGAAAGAAGTALAGVAVSALAVIGPVLLIVGAIALLYYAFKNNFMGITTTAKQLWWLLGYGFQQMWQSVNEGAQAGLEMLSEAWSQWVENSRATFQGWVEWIQNAWRSILDFFGRARDSIIQTFQRIDWSQIGKMILWGIANGMLLGLPAMIAAAIKAAKALKGSFDQELDINSPSGEFEDSGIRSWEGYIIGLTSGIPRVRAAVKSVAAAAINEMVSAQAAFSNYLKVNGYSGKPQFAKPTKQNLQAAFSEYLKMSGLSGKPQFAAATASNMNAAFAQYASSQVVSSNQADPFLEKSKPIKVEQVNHFSSGLTTKQAQDIYSEKINDAWDFLEKRLGS